MMRRVIGCMTGTSIDAIDAALVEIEGEGLGMAARFVRGASAPLGELGPRLRRVADQQPVTAGEIAGIAREFAVLHAEVAREVGAGEEIAFICVHGQTVYHAPPLSWQLFSPALLVRALRAPVVFDLRSADLAAGGQGAPITPMADWVLFQRATTGSEGRPVAIVNLGGFINITRLPARAGGRCGWARDAIERELDGIGGGDVCACNQLLDAIARACLSQPFDEDGLCAMRGKAHAGALEELMQLLASQARAGRSLGTGDEAGAWIRNWRSKASAEDLCATGCHAIAQTLGGEVRDSNVIIAGGGVRNRALVRAITSSCRGPVTMADQAGVPAEFREAACFAVLGALCQDRVPMTLSRITGAVSPPLAGCWMYP